MLVTLTLHYELSLYSDLSASLTSGYDLLLLLQAKEEYQAQLQAKSAAQAEAVSRLQQKMVSSTQGLLVLAVAILLGYIPVLGQAGCSTTGRYT